MFELGLFKMEERRVLKIPSGCFIRAGPRLRR
jgi:hypothetical protein